MNIFHKVALQGLKRSRTQTLVTIIGVMLSAALFTGVTTFAVSLQSYMVRGASVKYGGWHVELPASDSSFEEKAAKDSKISDSTALQNIGYAVLEGSKNANKPYLFLSGWDEKAFASLPLELLSGRMPENSSEVLIPAHLASNGGVKLSVGDTITLEVGDRISAGKKLCQHDAYSAGAESFVPSAEKTYTVVGVCQRPAIEEYSAPGYTLITTTDPAAEDSRSVFLTLKNPYRISSYIKGLGDENPYVLNEDVLRYMGLSGEKILTVLLLSISAILIILVVVGSVFLIYNAFQISLNERTHQFGILMSVGATARQLKGLVLFESLCIGAIGIPAGILIGLPGTQIILSLVEKNFVNLMYEGVSLDLVISLPAIIAAVLVSIITILISAYIPAKKAAAMPVMECIRQTNEVKIEAKRLKTSRFARRFLGLEEVLALKNFKRSKQRYRSVIMSLTFSVVLFVSASTFGAYLNQIAENSSQVVEQYDIVFASSDIEESQMLQLYDQLGRVSGVTVSAYQADMSYPCQIPAEELSDHFLDTFGEFIGYDGKSPTAEVMLDAVFVDDDTYRGLLESLDLSAEEYTGQDDRMIMAAYVEGYLYIQEEPMDFLLPDGNGNIAKTVHAAYVKDYPDLLPKDARDASFRGYSLMLIAPYEAKAGFDALGTAAETKLGLTFESDNPGGSTSQMQKIIDADGITADYVLYNLYAILEQNRNLNFIIHLFAAVFTVTITLISIANVFNTISTNIKLRRREFAMLRSVGMADREFSRMMHFECILYGVRTILWGLPLTVVMVCLIYECIILGGGYEIHFIFPWSSIGISILGVFLIVFTTMLYAAGKIRKENIMDALRDELT